MTLFEYLDKIKNHPISDVLNLAHYYKRQRLMTSKDHEMIVDSITTRLASEGYEFHLGCCGSNIIINKRDENA